MKIKINRPLWIVPNQTSNKQLFSCFPLIFISHRENQREICSVSKAPLSTIFNRQWKWLLPFNKRQRGKKIIKWLCCAQQPRETIPTYNYLCVYQYEIPAETWYYKTVFLLHTNFMWLLFHLFFNVKLLQLFLEVMLCVLFAINSKQIIMDWQYNVIVLKIYVIYYMYVCMYTSMRSLHSIQSIASKWQKVEKSKE